MIYNCKQQKSRDLVAKGEKSSMCIKKELAIIEIEDYWTVSNELLLWLLLGSYCRSEFADLATTSIF